MKISIEEQRRREARTGWVRYTGWSKASGGWTRERGWWVVTVRYDPSASGFRVRLQHHRAAGDAIALPGTFDTAREALVAAFDAIEPPADAFEDWCQPLPVGAGHAS